MKTYKKLPHIDLVEHYQFVTFRTADSVDGYVKMLQMSNQNNSKKQYLIDNYLDGCEQGAFLKGHVIAQLREYILAYDALTSNSAKRKMYEVVALCIMPNHVHILFRQLENLSSIMRILKGGTTALIHKLLDREGTVWEEGYYDVGIRNQEHFDRVYRYIQNNAIKANLSDSSVRLYGIY
ncbi:MAG: transposase [Campylobacterales bacterium]|nr:transposase [Campylobacterales bacterium]